MATYKLISSSIVGSGGTSSVEFTSIPSTYTDLCIVFSFRNEGNNAGAFMRFNGDTGSNYIYNRMTSGWNNIGSDKTTNTFIFVCIDPATATTSAFGSGTIYIANYAASTKKPVSYQSVLESNASSFGGGAIILGAGVWTGTDPITSISFISEDSGKKLVEYSSAYLYGISNA